MNDQGVECPFHSQSERKQKVWLVPLPRNLMEMDVLTLYGRKCQQVTIINDRICLYLVFPFLVQFIGCFAFLYNIIKALNAFLDLLVSRPLSKREPRVQLHVMSSRRRSSTSKKSYYPFLCISFLESISFSLILFACVCVYICIYILISFNCT